ncbi:hypothetical protein M2447_000550 [Ereboglobus sp. PH5-10]|uniref:hypothetical protein n=1 Tax=Ereboglobus sp. PH5-10 TaxID=2940629 RepID=UPI002406B628|nr:hypothetical protein [Ereboglobus sp. PH5-10]MDF9826469.1 hypothetical protein [Ereboglobus sp. PH5-10]
MKHKKSIFTTAGILLGVAIFFLGITFPRDQESKIAEMGTLNRETNLALPRPALSLEEASTYKRVTTNGIITAHSGEGRKAASQRAVNPHPGEQGASITKIHWLNSDEVKSLDFEKIKKSLNFLYGPPKKMRITNRDQATDRYMGTGAFAVEYLPSLGYEDADYYYFFWLNKNTGEIKADEGGAISKKTSETFYWLPR